jgi:TetR/AcrR family transcriptional repressor of lmrAB and yxaGH operons
VALEAATTSERLNAACEAVYGAWQAAFEAKFVACGIATAEAAQLATLVIAALEGAIILSRTRRSTEPLEHAATALARLIHTAVG